MPKKQAAAPVVETRDAMLPTPSPQPSPDFAEGEAVDEMLPVSELLELAEVEPPPAVSDEKPPEPAAPSVIALPPLDVLPGPGYSQYHIDAKLSGSEITKFRRLMDGLRKAGTMVRVGDGVRAVDRPADGIRWLIQQIPD